MSFLQEMAGREKRLWAALLVDLIVALYYFPNALSQLLQSDDVAAGAWIALIINSTVLGIVLAILLHFVFRVGSQNTAADERELGFSARASSSAYVVLQVLVLGLMCASVIVPAVNLVPPIKNPVLIAHLMLLAVILSRLVKSGSELFYFRRAY